MQCKNLLGLARRNTKKRGNNKYGDSIIIITPIRYNIIYIYFFSQIIIVLLIFFRCGIVYALSGPISAIFTFLAG